MRVMQLVSWGVVAVAVGLYAVTAPVWGAAEETSAAAPPDAGEDGWKPLFDGESFDGWEGDFSIFRIEDEAIVGGSLERRIPVNYFLCTKEAYGDFELRLKAKLVGEAPNAGVQIRSWRVPDSTEMIGYQADLGENYWGSLYDESRRNRIIAQADPDLIERCVKPDDWNEYRIRCDGPRVQLWLNGEQTVDYVEPDADIEPRGLIGLQIHSGPPAEAWYKDIAIRAIHPEPPENADEPSGD